MMMMKMMVIKMMMKMMVIKMMMKMMVIKMMMKMLNGSEDNISETLTHSQT